MVRDEAERRRGRLHRSPALGRTGRDLRCRAPLRGLRACRSWSSPASNTAMVRRATMAKGTRLLGVKAVVARSYERIHRSNLVGMLGVLPLQFEGGTGWETLADRRRDRVDRRACWFPRHGRSLTLDIVRWTALISAGDGAYRYRRRTPTISAMAVSCRRCCGIWSRQGRRPMSEDRDAAHRLNATPSVRSPSRRIARGGRRPSARFAHFRASAIACPGASSTPLASLRSRASTPNALA